MADDDKFLAEELMDGIDALLAKVKERNNAG